MVERSNRVVPCFYLGKASCAMLWLLLFMMLVLTVAGLVVVYVAYPHRGEDVPGFPLVGAVMTSAARSVPTLDADEVRERASAR